MLNSLKPTFIQDNVLEFMFSDIRHNLQLLLSSIFQKLVWPLICFSSHTSPCLLVSTDDEADDYPNEAVDYGDADDGYDAADKFELSTFTV